MTARCGRCYRATCKHTVLRYGICGRCYEAAGFPELAAIRRAWIAAHGRELIAPRRPRAPKPTPRPRPTKSTAPAPRPDPKPAAVERFRPTNPAAAALWREVLRGRRA